VTIVQPGAFTTNWLGQSLATTELLPAYEGSPAAAMRDFFRIAPTVIPFGDPARAADVIIKMSQAAQPPMKLPLGPDAVALIQSKLEQLKTELDQWKALAASTSDEPDKQLSSSTLEKLFFVKA
jgi:hypothetical protein